MDEQSPELKEKGRKKTSKPRPRQKTSKEKSLLLLELSEIKEISDKLFERIEKKIEVLRALETSVDEKILALRKLGQERVPLETPSADADNRPVVISLKKKGLSIQEIAGILGMPVGEVELILNLKRADKSFSNGVRETRQDNKIYAEEPQVAKNTCKMPSRRLLLMAASLLIGLIILYIVFVQRNNTPSKPLNVVQPGNVQQENREMEKSKALDLIRQKYDIPSDMKAGRQMPLPKQREPQQLATRTVKGIEQKELKKTVTVATENATIRSKPSLDSQPLTWVSKGVVFEIKEESADDTGKKWYKVVTSGGKEGWLADKVVKESP
jgi:type II secretory pathway component PulM